MKSFDEAIQGEGWDSNESSAFVHIPDGEYQGRDSWYEVRLEALMFGQFYLAVYSCGEGGEGEPDRCELLAEKVPVRKGGPGSV